MDEGKKKPLMLEHQRAVRAGGTERIITYVL